MISVRRLIASMLAGALLVLASAAQASAQPAPDLDRALEGVALGLAAASELAGDGDVIVVDEGLIEALGVYHAWAAKHADAGREIRGQGPENAQAVHAALLAREVPGQMKKDSGSKLSELATVYETLKGRSDEAKAAKDAKEKSNNGKSDEDKSNNGKSDEEKSSNGKSDEEKSNNGKSDEDKSNNDKPDDRSDDEPSEDG